MTARTANAFLLSATIHALFAAALLYTAYSMKDEVIDKAKIFELVAGAGDNYAATEAPALGTPEGKGINIEMPPGPPTPAPAPVITPPAPDPVVAPAPEPPAPVEAVAPPKVVPKPVAKPEPSPVVKAADAKPTPKVETLPNPAKTFNRKTNAIAAKQKAQRDKEAKEAAKQAALAAKNAEIAAKKAALLAQANGGGGGQSKVTKIDAEGIAAGVRGGSTANKIGGAGGTALSREEQDLLGTYIALLKQHFREAHEKPTGLSDLLAAKVEFYVAADGSISRVSITQSSGNAEFDQSVLAAIRNARTIGPRPDGKGSMLSTRFKMKDED
jgi:colicin import membrane protein